MKYLILVKVRRDAPLSPELSEAHRRAINEQVEKRLAEAVYIFAGTGVPDGMCILNADTPEQLNELILAAPGFRLCDLQVHPLVEFNKAVDQWTDLLNKSRNL